MAMLYLIRMTRLHSTLTSRVIQMAMELGMKRISSLMIRRPLTIPMVTASRIARMMTMTMTVSWMKTTPSPMTQLSRSILI